MRYPASEKLEIIRLVEQSHLGVGSTLDKLGIPKTTFYRWYDRFLAFGDAGLEDRNRSSAWSSSPTWASGPLWTSWAFRRPPFIAGTIAFWPLATPVLRIATAVQAGCGTGSRMMSGGRSSILPWRALVHGPED